MNKFLVLLIITTILFMTTCNHNCGSSDIFTCPDDSTCCQGPTGKICHKILNGQCCEDLLTCCDANSNCDNILHTCVAKPTKFILKFLE